jgi:hypothetical protein
MWHLIWKDIQFNFQFFILSVLLAFVFATPILGGRLIPFQFF